MGDVYVEVGDVKGKVDNKYLSNAQAGLKAAVTEAVNKAKSGMTTVKPGGGKGIRVSVMVKSLAQDGNDVSCSLIGVLQQLPGKEPFTPSASASGEGKVAGKIDAVAGDCVKKAAADMLAKVGPSIAGSQAAPAATGTAASKSPLIYIAPADVSYPDDAKDVEKDLKDKAKAAVIEKMKQTFGQNPKRFTLDSNAFKQGSGMPAHVLHVKVDKFVFDPTTKEVVATVKAAIADYPSDNIRVMAVGATSKGSGFTRPPREADKMQVIRDAAQSMTEKAIKWLLDTYP